MCQLVYLCQCIQRDFPPQKETETEVQNKIKGLAHISMHCDMGSICARVQLFISV
jgi:hypothetical protein